MITLIKYSDNFFSETRTRTKNDTSNLLGVTICYCINSYCNGAVIDKCDNGGTIPDKVTLSNCPENDSFCKVVSYEELIITMKFNAPRYLENITPSLKVKTLLGEHAIRVESQQKNACLGILNTFCPLVAMESIDYVVSVNFTVSPLIPVILEFNLMDKDTNDSVICFKTNVYTLIHFNL
ncbi:hypothetical protein JTB14_001832 [Gonioctena quinquepunctata]|nr:hypothetical protein JTB14_001832 [Gonioctena quinquepunctata]